MVAIGDKISELPPLVRVDGTENIAVQKGKTTYRLATSILNGSVSLKIRKVYNSVSAMNSDGTAPVGSDGIPIKAGEIVSIYNSENSQDPDNNSIYSFQNPGWLQTGKLSQVDSELSDTSTNPVENRAVSQFINELNLNIFKTGQYDLISAITEASNNIPDSCKKPGFKLFFNDSDNKLRRYVFNSDSGSFINPTNWIEVFDSLYFDYHEQPLGSVYDIASLIKEIRISTDDLININDDYSIGTFGFSPSFNNNIVQICKNKKIFGTLVYEDGEFEKTDTLEGITFTISVYSFDTYASSSNFNYKDTNIIAKQLFSNANLQYIINGDSFIDKYSNLFVLKEIGKNKFNKESQEIKQGYYTTGGVFVSNPDNFTTPKIPIKDGETLICNAANNTSQIIRQLIFDKDDNIIYEGTQTKTLTGIENSSYCIFSCNAVGSIGIDGCQVEVGDVSTSYEPYKEYSSLPPSKKSLSLDYLNTEGGIEGQVPTIAGNSVIWRTPTGQSDVKVYGVKQSIADPTDVVWERTDDAVGLISATQIDTEPVERDDFISVYPFNQMKECNIIIDSTGATEIIYEDDERFGRDKDTFIEIPLFYMDRYIKDGYEYRKICEVQKGGFFPAPMFVENGRVLDRVYIAKYETSVLDGIAFSKSGAEPASYKTISEFRNLYNAKGKGFAGMDIRTVMSLQHLYLVRFAEKNSQNYIGGGFTDIFQPWGGIAKDYSAPSGEGGKIETKNYVKTYKSASFIINTIKNKFWIGKNIGFVKSNESKLYDRATITDIQISEDGKQATIYFDKEVEIIEEAEDSSLNNDTTPVRTWFGGCGQNTGSTDTIEHDTGRTEFKSDGQNKGTCGVKLFNIENLWGNLWHELDGLIFKYGTCYVGFSQKDYNDEATGYVPIGTKMIDQPDLGSVGAQFCFIGNLWVDSVYRWLGYPNSFRGGNTTDTQFPSSGITQDNSYGDAYYYKKDSAISIEVHGGGFDHYERAGLFCHRCWNDISSKWYLQGSRMQFKIFD